MSSRNYQSVFSLDRNVVVLNGAINFGLSGNIARSDCLGFSASHSTTGTYTITLDDKYPQSPADYSAATGSKGLYFTSPMLGVHTTWQNPGTRFLVDTPQIISSSIHTSGTFVLQFDSGSNGSGVPANPVSGSTMFLNIWLRNTSTVRKGV